MVLHKSLKFERVKFFPYYIFLKWRKTFLLIKTLSTRDLYKESNKEEIARGNLKYQEVHPDI